MTITLDWDDAEKVTLLITYTGHWEWEEVYEACPHVAIMLDEVAHDVHFIQDLAHGTMPATNPLPHLKYLASLSHPNTARSLTAYVGVSPFWRIAQTTMTKAYPEYARDIVYVSTLDDARRAIVRKRIQLAEVGEASQGSS
jgi:hypothetical protein